MKSQTFFRLSLVCQKKTETHSPFLQEQQYGKCDLITSDLCQSLYSHPRSPSTPSFLELVFFMFLFFPWNSTFFPCEVDFFLQQNYEHISGSIRKCFVGFYGVWPQIIFSPRMLPAWPQPHQQVEKPQMPRCHKSLVFKYRHPTDLAIISYGLNVF